ncbi:MAG: hypothetical protein HKN49_12320, partial [Gammaproteobacteria bacterium]|nr:hypothetical protein [Gammaproteobacteria bacterium]
MKSTRLLLALMLATMIPLAGVTQDQDGSRALLDVGLEFPLVTFNNDGMLAYEAASGSLSINATPLAVLLQPAGPASPPISFGPGGSLSISAILDPLGVPVAGSISVSGDVDLGALGLYSGVLMTGEIVAFGFEDSGGPTDLYDFEFVPTGGALLFALNGGNIGVELTSESSSFEGDFMADFGGEAKGTLGRVGESVDPCVDDDDDDSSDDDSSDDGDDDSSDDGDDDSSDDGDDDS